MSNFSQNTSKMRWVQDSAVDAYEFSYFEMVMQWEWVFEKYILVEISRQKPGWVSSLNFLRVVKITNPILSAMGVGKDSEGIMSGTLRWRSVLPTQGSIYIHPARWFLQIPVGTWSSGCLGLVWLGGGWGHAYQTCHSVTSWQRHCFHDLFWG